MSIWSQERINEAWSDPDKCGAKRLVDDEAEHVVVMPLIDGHDEQLVYRRKREGDPWVDARNPIEPQKR